MALGAGAGVVAGEGERPTLSLEVIESTPLGWADWVWCVLLMAAMAARLLSWSLRDVAAPGAVAAEADAEATTATVAVTPAPQVPHWGAQHPAIGLLLFVVAQSVLGSGVLTLFLRALRVGQASALGMLAQALVMVSVHLGIVYGMAWVEQRSLPKATWALGAHASRRRGFGLKAAAGSGAALGIGATILLSVVLDGPQETSPMQEAMRMPGAMLALAAMATLSPWYEELFFRGYVQGALTSRFGVPIAATLSALLFGLVHVPQHLGYLWPLLPIFVVSAAASTLRAWSGSTAAPFALHLGYNLVLVLPAMLIP
jgi:membrane protease YdiL (CAAX protease family)